MNNDNEKYQDRVNPEELYRRCPWLKYGMTQYEWIVHRKKQARKEIIKTVFGVACIITAIFLFGWLVEQL